jgi:type II secretory pathway component PulF
MTWGKLYWSLYLILASVAFLIPEFIAIFTNVRNTLSDYARFELNLTANVSTHTIAWWISLCAWGLFIVVMTLHIWGNQLG